MKKIFTFVLPDEPYKATTDLQLTVDAVYEGHRYLVARVEEGTNIVHNVAFATDDENEIDLTRFVEEGHRFIVIDARMTPFEAAYLTGNYTHDLIEDPTYVLPRGLGEWTYHYDDYTGGISQAFYQTTLKHVNGKFSGPKYREHAITRESLIENSKLQAKTIEASLAENDFTPEDRTKLQEYATWLKNIETTYEGVDHWKIPFPGVMPKY